MLATISHPLIHCTTADIATVDLNRRFDLIVIAGALEFVENPAAVLANARRHVAHGGRFALLVPPLGLMGSLYFLYHRLNGLRINLFTSASLEKIAARTGWRIRSSRLVWPHAQVISLEPIT